MQFATATAITTSAYQARATRAAILICVNLWLRKDDRIEQMQVEGVFSEPAVSMSTRSAAHCRGRSSRAKRECSANQRIGR